MTEQSKNKNELKYLEFAYRAVDYEYGHIHSCLSDEDKKLYKETLEYLDTLMEEVDDDEKPEGNIEPKNVTFKALFRIGDKFRFTNTADGTSGVYVIIKMYYETFAYNFSDFNKVCSELTYRLMLKEGRADYSFPLFHRISEERLAVIEDEKSELIEQGFRYKIEKL
ncbi:MAG: hypothetical protein J5767_12495 [Paludibacteraceae bacterium]|nr:hypothetical protein [Paludibacteraceae bacterium]